MENQTNKKGTLVAIITMMFLFCYDLFRYQHGSTIWYNLETAL
ncbi:hypothetical protein PMEL_200582 [Prevotella melaninogenica]|uniref:Uncharacterized protein n=1 Tax=Prevotella melaninogenica TaxID=28132 RepID=A0A250KJG9_9BACT|nr:hypothetical protein PMEL_200582 [Prevotella melaninogenica]